MNMIENKIIPVYFNATPQIISTPVDDGREAKQTTVAIEFVKTTTKETGHVYIKTLCVIPVTDRKGLYMDDIAKAPDWIDNANDKASCVVAQLICLAATSATKCVTEMNISTLKKESRVKELAKKIRDNVLYRDNIRLRSKKGFERLLLDTINNTVKDWQEIDNSSINNYIAPIRRPITTASALALDVRSRNFAEELNNYGGINDIDYVSQFVKKLQEQTKEAALSNTTGYQKASFAALEFLIDECRRNNGRLGNDLDHPDAILSDDGVDGLSLSVTPEKFLDVMGLYTKNRHVRSIRKNEIGRLLIELRDRPFTLLAEKPGNSDFVFTSRRNLFSFSTVIHGNDTLWIFSNLSALTLPVGMKGKKANWLNQYDRIPINGIRWINATFRSEIAQAAINIMWPILIYSSRSREIYGNLYLSESGAKICHYKPRQSHELYGNLFESDPSAEVHRKKLSSRRKVIDAITQGLAIDGREITFDNDKSGCYRVYTPSVQEEEDVRREIASVLKSSRQAKKSRLK